MQPKSYQDATPNGRFVYFTSGEKLTNNSQAEPGVPDLYRYDVETDGLVDLTTADPDGAGVQGVLGVSDNGSRVYFGASGALAPGATDNAANLYVRDGSTTTFIADLDLNNFPSDADNWATQATSKLSRVTPSGDSLFFGSRHEQLGYDNAGFMEFYVYDLGANEFACVSCRPNGAPATADTILAQAPGPVSLTGLEPLPAPELLRRWDDGVLHQPGAAAPGRHQRQLRPVHVEGRRARARLQRHQRQ